MQSAKVRDLAKGQEVLIASFVLTVASMFLIPPSAGYLDYIDVRTLCILLAMMAVIAAIADTGALENTASRLLAGCRKPFPICVVLILVPTFLSMFITNDVALLTFVPFGFLVLRKADLMDLAIPVAVLQTIGANAGSCLFQFGNPQNIFLSSKYGIETTDFVGITGWIVFVGILMMCALMRFLEFYADCHDSVNADVAKTHMDVDSRRLAVMIAVMALCIAAVLRMIPYLPATAVAVFVVALVSRGSFRRVDWGLLLTFVFLFVFAGNISHVEVVREALEGMMAWDSMVSSALVSQVVSNVPAAVMLSNFTDDWQGLLAGVNIGGFGTPIASMASVITLRLYSRMEGARVKRYLLIFTAANIVMLAFLLFICRTIQRRFFFAASGL